MQCAAILQRDQVCPSELMGTNNGGDGRMMDVLVPGKWQSGKGALR
jgi:hypothetical protein